MESAGSTLVGIPERALDLSSGLDDPNFSDRTLLLHIAGAAGSNGDPSHRVRNAKRRRTDEPLINPSTPDTISSPPRMKTIHITSLILAASSPFFRKLFTNGMQESKQKHVTLRIEASEEVSFMDLLKYVYSNNLPTTFDGLLGLLLTADKFEVDSCSKDCTRALQNLRMTCESASVILDLPQSLLMSPTVQPLVDAAKKFIAAKYNDLQKFEEEVLNLPLLGLQAVLSSDNLQVIQENDVYDFVMYWAVKNYPNLEERREILKTHLLHLVRFPFMSTTELTEGVLTCSDIDPNLASEIVIRALSFKAETVSLRKHFLAAEEEVNVASRQFVGRKYIYRHVKVIELELPHPYCAVYLDLTRSELNSIFPDGDIWSETIHLGGEEFCLSANCTFKAPSIGHTFGLALEVLNKSTSTIKYEFSVRKKQHGDFEKWFKGSHKFTGTGNSPNLHEVEWTRFLAHDSSYFINDILHVKAELTIKK